MNELTCLCNICFALIEDAPEFYVFVPMGEQWGMGHLCEGCAEKILGDVENEQSTRKE